MDPETQTTIHHLAMALRQGGDIAKAVARIRDPIAVADMMIAQRLLREALAKHRIACSADLGGSSSANDADLPTLAERTANPSTTPK